MREANTAAAVLTRRWSAPTPGSIVRHIVESKRPVHKVQIQRVEAQILGRAAKWAQHLAARVTGGGPTLRVFSRWGRTCSR